jgi:beta-glucosidase
MAPESVIPGKEDRDLNIRKLIKELTLEEKAGLCSGLDAWRTKPVARLGIPSIMMSDGPHGLRVQRKPGEGERTEDIGQDENAPMTAFPAACLTACSFDPKLLYGMGRAIGDEARAAGVNVVLGPGANIKRSPLGGRNFEYFSEDPCLSGRMAEGWIKGLQSRNVGASLKHYAGNNQEFHRFTIDEAIDDKALREIYLKSFEIAVRRASPWAVMCSYNKINGVHASENEWLLNGILRETFGYDGLVVSDWGAVSDRPSGITAGLDLEMPSSGGANDKEIAKAVKSGALSEKDLDKAVANVLRLVERAQEMKPKGSFDIDRHHETAIRTAEESAVLLRNNDGILPVEDADDLLLIGEYAERPRYAGGGSSHVTPTKLSDIVSQFERAKYVKGYRISDDRTDRKLLGEAVKAAGRAGKALLFLGLPDSYECESYDRKHMSLPPNQLELLQEVSRVCGQIAVVLFNGSPISMDGFEDVKGILEMYLPGQGVAEATYRLATGIANPCGKLAESFPLRLSDNPSYLDFPLSDGCDNTVYYREGTNVGYRYYRRKGMPCAFDFGFGLSYTDFRYAGLRIRKVSGYRYSVSVDVTNTGGRDGKEAVQLYVDRMDGDAIRFTALRKFDKVFLKSAETKTVRFTLDREDFAEYLCDTESFEVVQGEYRVHVFSPGRESADVQGTIVLKGSAERSLKVDLNTRFDELMAVPAARKILEPIMAPIMEKEMATANESITPEMKEAMLYEAPLRALRNFYGYSQRDLDRLIRELRKVCRK